MPRYYFNLCQGSETISHDAIGYECPNDEAARQFARLSKGFVALDPFLSTWPEHRFEVIDEAGRSVFTLPVSKPRIAARKLGTADGASFALSLETRGNIETNLPVMYGLTVGR
jgi:hypothetical protein